MPSSAARSDFPLSRFPLLAARDVAAAERALGEEIAPHRFEAADGRAVGTARLTCYRLPRTRLFGVQFGARVVANAPPTQALQFAVPLKGELIDLAQNACRAGPGDALVHLPGCPTHLVWGENSAAVVVWVARRPLDDLVRQLFRADLSTELELRSKISLSNGPGRSVRAFLDTLLAELDDPESLTSRGITARALEEALLTAILHAIVESPRRDAPAERGDAALTRVLGYIRRHLRDPVTMEQLVAAAGLSARTLQYRFAQVHGVGPMSYVRREKLRAVREALTRARDPSVTVAAVAADWGFFDSKYLSRLYFREFGERPSETLRRVRRQG